MPASTIHLLKLSKKNIFYFLQADPSRRKGTLNTTNVHYLFIKDTLKTSQKIPEFNDSPTAEALRSLICHNGQNHHICAHFFPCLSSYVDVSCCRQQVLSGRACFLFHACVTGSTGVSWSDTEISKHSVAAVMPERTALWRTQGVRMGRWSYVHPASHRYCTQAAIDPPWMYYQSRIFKKKKNYLKIILLFKMQKAWEAYTR